MSEKINVFDKIKFLVPDKDLSPRLQKLAAVPTANITGFVVTKTVRVTNQSNGSLTYSFEGNVKRGVANGHGEIKKKNKLFFRGMFKDGRPQGKGKIYFSNGMVNFEGGFSKGEMSGKGHLYSYANRQHIKVESGKYLKGKLTQGITYSRRTGKKIFEGKFVNGKPRQGITYNSNEEIGYVGKVLNGKFEGKGVEYSNGKKYYDGMFKDGLKNGKGELFELYGRIMDFPTIVGVFKNNLPNGEVKMFDSSQRLVFKGLYEKDRRIRGTAYDYSTNQVYTGSFKNNLKDGNGKEINMETGELIRKGIWKNGVFTSGVSDQDRTRKTFRLESSIKAYIQSSDKNVLNEVPPKAIKAYLKKYAGKDVTGSKTKLIKQLEKFRAELNQERNAIVQGPTVFDAYEGTEVSVETFLEEDNRVIFISPEGNYYGAYLEQCQILYECERGRSFRNYIGSSDVRGILQFPSASGPKFYFDKSICSDLSENYNVFHFETEPKDIVVLSKAVARGENIVSALHCDPKDIIRISSVTKKEKLGAGLKSNITFEF